ncbi:DUF3572 domain-containing protein [Nitratireductor soli]|uniref:DUF3572 domain-containing protein n=1 Tax=Nitratireductor soli TaxID=1670619 RepID=UPI00065DFCC5|nr:DUF3572 domain-containing protein [Nitratireductor soli]
MQREEAETIAVSALSFIAAEPELLSRFLALTGIEAGDIRQAAAEPGFLAGVMQFILAHEPTVLRFSQASGIAPAAIGAALTALPHGAPSYDIQP